MAAPRPSGASSSTPAPQYSDIYQYGTLGNTLTDSIDELVSESRVEPKEAAMVYRQFARVMNEKFPALVAKKHEVKLSGHLAYYRSCDDVWTFYVKNATATLLATGEKLCQSKSSRSWPAPTPGLGLRCQPKNAGAKNPGLKGQLKNSRGKTSPRPRPAVGRTPHEAQGQSETSDNAA